MGTLYLYVYYSTVAGVCQPVVYPSAQEKTLTNNTAYATIDSTDRVFSLFANKIDDKGGAPIFGRNPENRRRKFLKKYFFFPPKSPEIGGDARW